jgi:hypothetical protein
MSQVDESREESEAWLFFETALQLRVERVPAAAKETADYIVDGEDPGYVVEVKARLGDEKEREALRERGQTVKEEPWTFHRWAVDAAHKACKQIRNLDPSGKRWWVLWLSVQREIAAETVFDQIVNSLYGVREVVYSSGEERAASRGCVGALAGAFEKSPGIDAAVVSCGEGLRFCVNDLRDDAKTFIRSSLYRAFAQHHPPISVNDLVSNRGYLQLDSGGVNRGDEGAVKAHLESKYGLSIATICDPTIIISLAEVRRHQRA